MPNVIQLPRLPVAPEHVPEPQHSLLVHDRDMTSTLAAHHEHEILLDVLEMMHGPSSVTRTVLLMAGDKPVEFGWITIQLAVFEPSFRELIREGRKPLGWILEQSNVVYLCDPHTYFKVEPDEKLRKLLKCADETSVLYGRINRISNQDGELIADVVEILPAD